MFLLIINRTKTNAGKWVEDTKAIKLIIFKELGKLYFKLRYKNK